MNIGNRIKQRREYLGLSVDELAAKLGKHRATIYRYENGDISGLPSYVLEPLAVALQTTPAWFLGVEAEETTPEPPQELTPKQTALIEQIRHLSDQQVDALLTLLKAQSDLQDPVVK